MRRAPWLAAVLATFLATSAAAPAPVRAPHATGPFLPLTVDDEELAQDGCVCTFLVGNRRHSRNLLQLSGRILLTRTRAGLNSCPISEAQFQAMTGPSGSADCGGSHIAIRSGPSRQVGDDEGESASTLIVTRGGRTRHLHGIWACAC
jgi:hypothetical protein